MIGIGENQSTVSKKTIDIPDKKVYGDKESEKNLKIIKALKSLEGLKMNLEGVKRTLLDSLKTD